MEYNLKGIKDIKEAVLDDAIESLKKLSTVEKAVIKKDIYTYEFDDQPILLIPISDPHIGNKQCNLDKLKATIEIIDKTPNCYTVLLGDMMETATKSSVGMSTFDEDFHLDDQMLLFAKMIKPLVAKNKVLAALTGNHEMRISYYAKLNPMELIAKELGIPYLGYSGAMLFQIGKTTYSIAFHHGASAGASPASKLMAMKKQSQVIEADLFLSGHTHGKMFTSDLIYFINKQTKEMDVKKRHYAVCGSFLEYWNGYGEMKILPPVQTGALSIKFNNKEHEIIIND